MYSSKGSAEIWYLEHSGFAVKTSGHFLIFDYYDDNPAGQGRSLATGVINLDELLNQNVLVFSSHHHSDHFNSKILNWGKQVPQLRYVLSHDIRAAKTVGNIMVAFPEKEYQCGNVKIRTLDSTDEGVAFIVQVDGMTIYHAGDLNWWHWEGEPDVNNKNMEKAYKKQIDTLKGMQIDIAFVPVDPQLDQQYLLGLDYFMRMTRTSIVFPMHFWKDYSIFDRIDKDPVVSDYANRIKRITHRGERFLFGKTKSGNV
jgi:L-ascorbate metabolism protein UlaG (beta-lactamase superfamily)